jgi:hypothetical protein
MPAGRVAPEFLIVLDTSASMNDAIEGPCAGACGARSKWSAAVSGLGSVLASTGATVNWGLELLGGGSDACTAGDVTVAPAAGTTGAILDELARRSIGGNLTVTGNTPTRAAVSAAALHFFRETYWASPAILLLTDGAPDCGAGAADPTASDTAGAVQAVSGALAGGVPTAVVGLGAFDAMTDDTWSALALAGGIPRSGSPVYYPVKDAAGLVAAVEQVIATVGTCIYTIPDPPGTSGATSRDPIAVLLDGNEIPEDFNAGWAYTDASHTHVQIHGPACDAVRAGTATMVAIAFRCLI